MHGMHNNVYATVQATAPNLAKLVRATRLRKRLNQAAFAEIIGKTQGMVSRYESGESVPPSDVLMYCMHEESAPVIRPDLDQALAQVQQAAEALLVAITAFKEAAHDA
jgi:transcriptional regulator with XRE-family HTH domain